MPKFVWGSELNSFFYQHPGVWFPSHWQWEHPNPSWMAEKWNNEIKWVLFDEGKGEGMSHQWPLCLVHIFLHIHSLGESSKKPQCMLSVKAGRSFCFLREASTACLNSPLTTAQWHFCWIHIRDPWQEHLLQQLRGKITSMNKITSTWINHTVFVKLSSHISHPEWTFGEVGTKIRRVVINISSRAGNCKKPRLDLMILGVFRSPKDCSATISSPAFLCLLILPDFAFYPPGSSPQCAMGVLRTPHSGRVAAMLCTELSWLYLQKEWMNVNGNGVTWWNSLERKTQLWCTFRQLPVIP